MTAASILNSAREAQSSLTATSADAAEPDQGDLGRDRALAHHGHREHHRQHPDQRAQRAEHARRRLQRGLSTQVKSTSSEIERSVLAAGNSFGSTMTGKTDEIVSYVQQQTDRLSQMIDGKRGPLVEAIGAKTNQLTVEIDRVTADALKSIETRGQTFSQSMIGQRLRRRADHHHGRRTRHRRGQQVAEGPRTVLAHRDRAVAPGLDRRRHRDAGDQQDPAHRYGRAVRAAARRQHPAAGSADRRPRQPQLAGARAGHPRGRLRLRHERRHLAQRRRDPDAGRPAHGVQHQDRRRRWRISARCPASSTPTARRWSRPQPWSSRATATPPPRSPTARRRWNRWSRPSICAPPISISGCRASPACSMNRWRRPRSARATSPAWWRRPPAPARPRSAGSSRRSAANAEEERRLTTDADARDLSAGHAGSGCDVQAVRGQVRHDGAEHEADGRRDAQRARGHPRASCAAACWRCRRRPPRAPRRCAR